MSTNRKWSRTQSQILVWAGLERLRIMYDGDEILVPSREETARKSNELAASPFRYESAMTKTGHYIPGTLLMMDRFKNTEAGGYEKAFDVTHLCEWLDRERQDLFARGFAIVSDPEDVTPIMREQLIPAWDGSQDARAREIVATELERRKRLEAKGNPITPGSSEHLVLWAFKHLAKRQASSEPMLTTEDLFKVASGTYVPTAKEAADEAAPKVYIEPGDARALYAEAKAMGMKLTKPEVEGLLDDDADTKTAVTEKLRARRKDLEEIAAS
jgi:hypothetical protein